MTLSLLPDYILLVVVFVYFLNQTGSASPSLQGFKQQALAVSTDPEHRFELALQLGELQIAYQLAVEAEVRASSVSCQTVASSKRCQRLIAHL